MRIAHFIGDTINPNATSGVPKSVYYTAKAQAELGEQVAVFCVTPEPPVEPAGVLVKSYPRQTIRFIVPDALFSDLEAFKPDVLHMHSCYVPEIARLYPWLRRKRIPYVSTPRGALSPYVTKRRPYIKYPYKWLLELRILNHSLFVHSVGDHANIKQYGVKAPIVDAHNGIDLDAIPNPPNRQFLSERYPQVAGKRAFIFLGRLDPYHKGLDVLVDAWHQAQPQDAVLVLVGPDFKEATEALREQVKNLGLESQIIFAGPAYGDEKFHLLSSAHVFVHPSRWEGGVPHSLLEAASCRLPSIITKEADPLGMLARYEAATVVPLDVEALSAEIERFARLPEVDLQTLGARARRCIEEELSWTSTARILIHAYKQYLKWEDPIPTR